MSGQHALPFDASIARLLTAEPEPQADSEAIERQRQALLGMMGPAGQSVVRLLGCMDLAEQEIRAAMLRHPEQAETINALGFALLQPLGELGSWAAAYRRHCAEILDAIALGQEPPAVTWAEVCLAFALACLRAPFNTEAAVAYGMAFRRAGFELGGGFEVPDSTDALYMLPEAEQLLAGVRRIIERAKAVQP